MKELHLRGYQESILGKLRDGFIAGHNSQILYAPTGAGKTICAIDLLRATMEKGNRSAMVLDRRVLVEQTSARLDEYGIDHGVLMSGHWRYEPSKPIQICSAQTLEKRGAFPGLKLLIVDEAHTTRKQTIDFIRGSFGVKVVGLTATPFTKGLGNIYTNVATATTTHDLVESGALAPLRVFISKEIDMTGAKKVAGEWSQKDATERGIKITGDVVAEWVKKTHEVFGGPRKTIVFCAGVAHGADLTQKFADVGYNFINLSYRDDDEFKKDAISEFSKPDSSIHGLIATDILTKGFDVPDAMIGISARPFTKSLSSHIQQMGRVMRSHPGKDFALWLDFSGNYLRFRDRWDDVYTNGVSVLDDDAERPQREPTQREKEASKCPCCGYLWPGNSDVCPSCGHVRARRNDVIAVPGEVVELDVVRCKKATMEDKQIWYSQLLGIARRHGYKDGWVAHKMKEKFGVWPRGLSRIAVEPSPEVASWVRSRNIRWAKSRRSA